MKQKIFHNLGLKITTLLCAFILWQLITGVADPIVTETYRDIPVSMLNDEIITDQGKVYQIAEGNTITVVLKGKTSILRQVSKEDVIATANFEALELSSLVPIEIRIENNERNQIEATASPNNVKVNIEDSSSKKFPITVAPVGEVAEDFVLGETTLQKESVTISGPMSIVDKIAKVESRINVNDISQDTTIESELVYYDADGLAIEQTLLSNELSEAVSVDIIVYPTKTIPLEFSTTGDLKINHEVVDITSEPTEIKIYGTEETLKEYAKLTVDGSVLDVSGLSSNLEAVIDLTEYIPDGLNLFDESKALVAVTVQIDEYGTKTLQVPVQSITVHSNPNDLSMEYNAITELALTFTGTDSALDKLNIENVRLSIDLGIYTEAGVYDVDVNVTTSDECKLVKSITVPIKLK